MLEAAKKRCAQYREHGFVHVPGLLTADEVRCYQQELERLTGESRLFDEKPEARPRQDKSGRAVFDRVEPVSPVSALFAQLPELPRLSGLVADLMGCPARLFKEKLIFKPPGTSGYLSHQDYAYWTHLGLPADHMLTVMVAFDPINESNGGTEFFSGCHTRRLPAPDGEPNDVDEACLAQVPSRVVCCAPGDAVVFHSLVPHRSGRNVSDRSRRAWFSSWSAARWGDQYTRIYGDRLHTA